MKPTYYRCCVNWPQDDVSAEGGLSDMIDQSRTITRRTFLQHVDRASLRELEAALGYARHPRLGLHMARDWHVSYSRSRLHGERVYYFTQSAIEYVFRGKEE